MTYHSKITISWLTETGIRSDTYLCRDDKDIEDIPYDNFAGFNGLNMECQILETNTPKRRIRKELLI